MRIRCSTLRNTPIVFDDSGKKTAVLLAIGEYKKLIEESKELEVVRAYDAAHAAKDKVIPFEPTVTEIERSRR